MIYLVYCISGRLLKSISENIRLEVIHRCLREQAVDIRLVSLANRGEHIRCVVGLAVDQRVLVDVEAVLLRSSAGRDSVVDVDDWRDQGVHAFHHAQVGQSLCQGHSVRDFVVFRGRVLKKPS